jgi:hypothetical protein
MLAGSRAKQYGCSSRALLQSLGAIARGDEPGSFAAKCWPLRMTSNSKSDWKVASRFIVRFAWAHRARGRSPGFFAAKCWPLSMTSNSKSEWKFASRFIVRLAWAHRTRGRSPGSFAAKCWPLRMTSNSKSEWAADTFPECPFRLGKAFWNAPEPTLFRRMRLSC